MVDWRTLSTSLKAKEAFAQLTGVTMKSHSNTRWFSEWTQAEQVSANAEVLVEFLTILKEEKICPTATPRLLASITPTLLVELAAYSDLGRQFVKATYFLEGDGFLCYVVFDVYQNLLNLASTWTHQQLDLVSAVLAESKTEGKEAAEYVQHGRSCMFVHLQINFCDFLRVFIFCVQVFNLVSTTLPAN